MLSAALAVTVISAAAATTAYAADATSDSYGCLAGQQRNGTRHAQFEQAAAFTTSAERGNFFVTQGIGKGTYSDSLHLDSEALAAAGIIDLETAEAIQTYASSKHSSTHGRYGRMGGLSPAERHDLYASFDREGGKLLLEKLTGGRAVKAFTGHIVHESDYAVTVLLCGSAKGISLGKEAADHAVIAFVTATLTRAIGMAIVDGQAFITLFIVFHAIAVLELGTVVYSDGLEGASGKHRDKSIEGLDGGGTCFTLSTQDNFIAGLTLGEDKEGFIDSLSFTNYAVLSPVAEGFTSGDGFGAAL